MRLIWQSVTKIVDISIYYKFSSSGALFYFLIILINLSIFDPKSHYKIQRNDIADETNIIFLGIMNKKNLSTIFIFRVTKLLLRCSVIQQHHHQKSIGDVKAL